MKVTVLSPFGQRTGYAQASHDYLLALHRAGADINIVPILDVDDKWDPGRYAELVPLVHRESVDSRWADVVIVHTIPAGLDILFRELPDIPESVKRVGLTTWETEQFPKDYADAIKQIYDQVWVPSQYNARALVNAGVPSKGVRVIPHTFDPDVWMKNVDRDDDPDAPYVFYYIMTWCERKNPIGLIKAYLTEFTQHDNVLLKIKTPGYNRKEIDDLARGLGLPYYPPVDLITDHYSEEEMRDLHYYSSCYVSCARAEGWGLGAFEALLVGNPVIATGYSGHVDFLVGMENVNLIPYFLTPAYVPESLSNNEIEVAGMKIRAVARNTHTGIRGDQSWAEPDLHSAKKFMRRNYNLRIGPTDANKERLLNKFSYGAVGETMVKELEKLLG